MELATSTCLFPSKRLGGRTTLIDSINMCYECGYRIIDLNFCAASNKLSKHELVGDDWEAKINEIGELGAKLGVTFSQSHPPFDSNFWRSDSTGTTGEKREWYMESVHRSIIASARLGVKWAIIHAQTDSQRGDQSFEQNIKANIEFYSPIVEWAKKYGTGIAVENMAEFDPIKTKLRFTAIVEEQIALIDALNDVAVGGCWDFGHAEMVYRNQVPALRKLGKRLKATHVQESDGKDDNHYLPYIHGKTNWEELMPLLKEIDYQGDFTYEVHGSYKNIPADLLIEAGKFSYKVGMYLIDLYNKA